MKITYIKLVNFKFMPHLDGSVFEHKFDEKVTMIAGCNGSGKSSLLNELTPLPSDKNSYWKHGYKEIHITKENKQYVLISDFREGTKYQFLVDGEEQNASNNVTTQRELAFFHFNMTPVIHEILTDKETFTGMSLAARKKLFSLITNINIDTVLDNYNSLKEELKNNEAVLKNQTSLYQAEEEKLASNNHIDYINESLQRTHQHIDFLLDVRSYLAPHRNNSDLNSTSDKVSRLKYQLQTLIKNNYAILATHPQELIASRRLEYTTELSVTNYQLNEFYSYLEKKQQDLKVLELNRQSNLSAMIEQEQTIAQQIQAQLQGLTYLKDNNLDLEQTQTELYKLESSLPDLLHCIIPNPRINDQRQFTKAKYEELLDSKKSLLEKLSEASANELTLQRQQTELSHTNDSVTCPSCSHTWSPQDIPSKLKHIHEHLQQTRTLQSELKEQLKQNEHHIQTITSYFNDYRQFHSIKKSTETLSKFWSFVDEQELFFNAPLSILQHLNTLRHDINIHVKVQELLKQQSHIQSTISTLSSIEDSSLEHIQEEMNEVLCLVDDLQSYKHTITENLKTLDTAENLHRYKNTLTKALEASVSDLKSSNLSYAVQEILSLTDTDLSKYKIVLIELEKEKHRFDTIQYTLNKYKTTIEDCKTNIKVLQLLLDELSPKNGLIAKSISSFLNIMISNINKTLAGIWSYKMVLSPINVETHNLDYRFKVVVEDKLEVNDIATCSRGMKNAIDLAFKLLMYKLLDLEGGYLVLDELGSNLDKEHTNSVFSLVQQLTISDKFTQLFIISHKENLGYLQNVDTIELS